MIVNHLSERHGFGGHPLSPAPPNPFFAFTLQDQPEGFWVAEDRGMVVGFAISRIYGPFWFLAYLFISPGCQSRGVGRALLERALRHEGRSMITNRGLITLAYNPVSISLYMKYGMYPRDSLYWMTGPREGIRARRPAPATGDLLKLAADQVGLSQLARIDEDVIGFARDRLHAYLLHAPGSSCYLFPGGGIGDGYAGNRRVTQGSERPEETPWFPDGSDTTARHILRVGASPGLPSCSKGQGKTGIAY